jgi:hypothetical protein
MKTSRIYFTFAAAVLTACATRPTPVPVIAPSSEMSALVGDWSGEYSSTETGRSGSIAFTLRAGNDTAIGHVVMLPKPSNDAVPYSANTDRPVVRASAAQTSGELLTIRFVRMEGNQLVGTLDPYRDPEDGCKMTTTFKGEFKDADTIEGTFTAVGSEMGHLPSSGRWKVTRLIK